MSPLPDNTEPERSRRSTDRRVKARELFKGQLTQADIVAASAAAKRHLAADETAMVRVRAKFAKLPAVDA